jgi:hypothetical protein
VERDRIGVQMPCLAACNARTGAPGRSDCVLVAAQVSQYHPALVLIASTGLRKGEALALRWDRVGLDAGVLRVAATIGRVGHRLVISEPKTARTRRPHHHCMAPAQNLPQACDRLTRTTRCARRAIIDPNGRKAGRCPRRLELHLPAELGWGIWPGEYIARPRCLVISGRRDSDTRRRSMTAQCEPSVKFVSDRAGLKLISDHWLEEMLNGCNAMTSAVR